MAEYNESQINSNETERIAAEQERINNEAQRQTNETEREAREATRQSNESTRISKEAERLAEEVNRQEAEASRVTRFNEMEAMVAEVEGEINELQNDVSEIQNDMNSAQTQTFTVRDAYKFTVDHDGMMPSLVTLNNIEGLSSVETNNANQKFLVNNIIHDICTIDIGAINYFDYNASTEIVGSALYDIINKSITVTGDNSQGWSGVEFNLDNLTEGKRYCLFCDNITVNSGGSGIEIIDGEINSLPNCYTPNFPVQSANNIVFTARANTIGIRLFCTAISGITLTQGSVTYENIQIYEVKEMIVPDIQLNSLPNGVKDEIKDGVYIKRVSDPVKLDTLSWSYSYSDDTHSMWYASLPNIALASAYDINDNLILCSHLQCGAPNNIDDAEPVGYYVSSHNSNHEVKIKILASDVSSVDTLYSWLTSNNVVIQYELETPEYIPINLNIKVDKGDTIVINTTKTMDLTYDIQLNTRAQIDVLQTNINDHNHTHSVLAIALKEAINKIEQLEARINELENK